MWCVLKCRPGRAEEIMASCRKTIPGRIMQDIFVFTYDRMKRYQGAWHVADDITALSQQLEPCREFALVLEDRTMLRRVEPEEEAFLRKLGGPDHHLEMSVGYIRDGVTHVVEGPLVGMERRICKIDRHKRIANILIPAGGLEKSLTAGLEITAKN